MNAVARRAGIAALLGLFLLVPGLEASGECGHYITSSSQDSPLTGQLKGQRMVTTTTTSSLTSGLTARLLSGSYTFTRTTTTVYWVGTYEMTDGTVRDVRCDSYQEV